MANNIPTTLTLNETIIHAQLTAIIEHAEEYDDCLPEILTQLKRMKEELENGGN